MVWLAVDKDGEIFLSKNRPYRTLNRNFPEKGFWKADGEYYRERLMGRHFLSIFTKENMTWDDEPVEFTEVAE